MTDHPSYTPVDPVERHKSLAAIHAAQDAESIAESVDWLDTQETSRPYRVLDVGCEYGAGTSERFGGDGRFTVTGLSNNPDAVEYAMTNYAAPNTTYETIQYDGLDPDSLGTFDIVFVSSVVSQRDDPEQFLSTLWKAVADPGVLMVRALDDTQHTHYPTDEYFSVAITATGEPPYESSQMYGHRLYTMFMQNIIPDPVNVTVNLHAYHTGSASQDYRKRYWNAFHATRIQPVLDRAEDETASDIDMELAEFLERAMGRIEEKICTDELFFDSVTVPLTTAYKQVLTPRE